jgi:integrase/recombinase XerC
MNIESINLAKINEFKAHLYSRKCSTNYIRSYLICIRSFVKFLNTAGLPMDYKTIKVPMERKREVIFFNKEEVNKFIKQISHSGSIASLRNEALIKIMLDSGLRIFECLTLNRDSIDFVGKRAPILGKGRKPRIVFFSTWSLLALNDYLQARTDNNIALFVTHDRSHPTTVRLSADGVRSFLRKASKKFGKKIRPHDLRRTFATNLRENGADMITIQYLLGHSNIKNTLAYIGIDYNHLQREHAAKVWY